MQRYNQRNIKKVCLACLLILLNHCLFAQGIQQNLEKAAQQFEKDPQLKHALFSFFVVEAKSGNTVFDRNSEIGMAPASCQKLFTAAAALELLGKEYRYKTELGYDGKIEDLILKGNLHIVGSGDPTLGSWRWPQTKEETVLDEIVQSLKQFHINRITGDILIDDSKFSIQPIPDGWIWQDIGNYYGAGCWGINWHENQYDMLLQTGASVGDQASISSTEPDMHLTDLVNQIKTGEKASGDNAYIYLPPYSGSGFTSGTIPLGETNFIISGSIPDAPSFFGRELLKSLDKNGIKTSRSFKTNRQRLADKELWPSAQSLFFTHYSPPLDSINYWFLRKSINLYGEALLKTLAFEKTGFGSTETGIDLLKKFWGAQGIEASAMHIVDGSGLSPQNRVTTASLVKVLQYAATRPWFNSFYRALPEFNGMKMKSGSIGGARSYAGYQTARDGTAYIFAIMVNNYDGSSSDLENKMWLLLDGLK